MLSQLMPLIQCGSRTFICESQPAVPFLLPGRCTSISHRWASFCTECHRQTDTYWPTGLLFQLHLGHREVLQFGGSGLCALPKLEPRARHRGLARADQWPDRRVQPRNRRGVVSCRVPARSPERLYRERLTGVQFPPLSGHCYRGYGGLSKMENESPWFHRKLLHSTL